ncbi:MAG: hypothetical protein WCF23_23275, partial [Candidatus Nitrosopolaris sp.]
MEEDNKNRIVDWKIIDNVTNDELLVELTELRFETSEEKDSRLAFEMIIERIMINCNPGGMHTMFYRGRLFRQYISRPTLQDLFNKINSTAKEASKNGFAELVQNNTMILGIATDDKKPLLKSWAIEKNVIDPIDSDRDCSDSSFKGPTYPINDVKRIMPKIKNKKGTVKKSQFNRKALNALVIRAIRLFLPNYIEEYINILEEFLYDHNFLGILIVVGGHLGGQDINLRRERNGHLYLIRSIDLITKEILILTNKYS